MQSSVKKIGIIVLLILLLPIVVFFIYQFASLNKSEEEIRKIYIQQLETILYSVNQYSEDIVSSWRNEIQYELKKKFEKNRENFSINSSSIEKIFTVDSSLTEFFELKNSETNTHLLNLAKSKLSQNKSAIINLFDYLDADYQKTEAMGKLDDNFHLILFAFSENGDKKLCGIIFKSEEFVKRNLTAKIAQACGDEFILAVINKKNNSIIHSCDKAGVNDYILEKSFWLIPDYNLAIKMKSGNIEDLLKQRYYENMIILSSLIVILLIGLWIIYRNIQRELRLTQLKSDFVSNVSHELRTPLSLISMYSETLVMDRLKSEDKKKEYYSVINNETNRLNKIVNSILNFSKMEAGTRKYNFSRIDLVKINNDVIETYNYHIKTKGFDYKINTTEEEHFVIADQDAIAESIINLIENAMKYSSSNKKFEIEIGNNKFGPYWEIQDFGIGISEADQKKIFDKFYRVSSGLVHNTKGTGLGLSLVKQIMIAHGGDIIVKSSVGKGSVFRLQFNKKFESNK